MSGTNKKSNNPKKKRKLRTAGRGSSNVFQCDNKGINGNVSMTSSKTSKATSSCLQAKKTSSKTDTPIISNGKCSSCSATDTTINESIKCIFCLKFFHALCRTKTGTISSNSIVSSVSFLDNFNPISDHFGNHSGRWGNLAFVCKSCKHNLSLKAQVKNSVTKANAEIQTFVSGNINDQDCSLINTSVEIDVVELSDPKTKDRPSQMNNIAIKQVTELDLADSVVSDATTTLNDSTVSAILTKLNKLSEQNLDISSGIKTLETKSNEIMSEIKSNLEKSDDTLPTACFNFAPTSNVENSNQPELPYNVLNNQFLSTEEKVSLTTFIDSCDNFSEVKSKNSSRDVAYFGEFGYRYGAQNHKASSIPSEIQGLIDKLNTMFPKTTINSCLITRYKSGNNCCPPHSDNESYIAPWSEIATLSIGCERTMRFTDINEIADPVEIRLSDNSLISFSRSSQEQLKHEITPSDSKTCRYSLTFRQIAPHYSNSTLIIGDSNTENLKFGSGRKTFGVWMPGGRVRASKVGAIPTPESISVPYNYINTL